MLLLNTTYTLKNYMQQAMINLYFDPKLPFIWPFFPLFYVGFWREMVKLAFFGSYWAYRSLFLFSGIFAKKIKNSQVLLKRKAMGIFSRKMRVQWSLKNQKSKNEKPKKSTVDRALNHNHVVGNLVVRNCVRAEAHCPCVRCTGIHASPRTFQFTQY